MLFVLDEEDPFPTAGFGGGFQFFRQGLFRSDGRKEDPEGGALSVGFIQLNPTLVLLNDTIDRCESQPGPLAGLLGGEKGIKNPSADGFRNTFARV